MKHTSPLWPRCVICAATPPTTKRACLGMPDKRPGGAGVDFNRALTPIFLRGDAVRFGGERHAGGERGEQAALALEEGLQRVLGDYAHFEERISELDARAALAAHGGFERQGIDDARLDEHRAEAKAFSKRARQRALKTERAFTYGKADRLLPHENLAERLTRLLLLEKRAQELLLGNRARADKNAAEACAQKEDDVLRPGLMQEGL